MLMIERIVCIRGVCGTVCSGFGIMHGYEGLVFTMLGGKDLIRDYLGGISQVGLAS